MSEAKVKHTTPVGEAKWAHLAKPKPAWKDESGVERGQPKYQIDVVFDPANPEWKAWATALNNRIKALPELTDKKTGEKLRKQNPIKKEFNTLDEHTGRYYVTFKTSDKFKPAVFDRSGAILEDAFIGNGSRVRVSYIEESYQGFGGGIALYLQAVQVLELVESRPQSASAYGFSVEEPADPFCGTKQEDEPPF